MIYGFFMLIMVVAMTAGAMSYFVVVVCVMVVVGWDDTRVSLVVVTHSTKMGF